MQLSFKKFIEATLPGNKPSGFYIYVKSRTGIPVAHQIPDDEVDLTGSAGNKQDIQHHNFGPFRTDKEAVAEFQKHLNNIHNDGSIIHISMTYYSGYKKTDLVWWNWTNNRENIVANTSVPQAVAIRTQLRVPPLTYGLQKPTTRQQSVPAPTGDATGAWTPERDSSVSTVRPIRRN